MPFSWQYIPAAILLFVASVIASFVIVIIIVVRLPADYFLPSATRRLGMDRHPVVRFVLHTVKNLLGLLLILLGIVQSVPGIPGQGILTIVIGIVLLDFPGKQRWERSLVGWPPIRRVINRIRQRFGQLPLQWTEDTGQG